MALEMPGPDFLLGQQNGPLERGRCPFNSGIQSWEDFCGAKEEEWEICSAMHATWARSGDQRVADRYLSSLGRDYCQSHASYLHRHTNHRGSLVRGQILTHQV